MSRKIGSLSLTLYFKESVINGVKGQKKGAKAHKVINEANKEIYSKSRWIFSVKSSLLVEASVMTVVCECDQSMYLSQDLWKYLFVMFLY